MNLLYKFTSLVYPYSQELFLPKLFWNLFFAPMWSILHLNIETRTKDGMDIHGFSNRKDKFWHFSRFEKLVSVCMKVLTTPRWPLLHAKWKGVQSLLSLTSRAMLKRAASSMKIWTISEWPFKHAKWKAVGPILSFLLRSKLNLTAFSLKIFTTSIQPWERARWKHVKPSVFETLKNYKVFC